MASRAHLPWGLSRQQKLSRCVGRNFDVVREPPAAAAPTAGNGAEGRLVLGLGRNDVADGGGAQHDALVRRTRSIEVDARQVSVEPFLGVPQHEVVLRS